MSETITHPTEEPEQFAQLENPEIQGVVLKINNDCNLWCYPDEQGNSGCYMYAKDTTYQQRPHLMGQDVVEQVATRLAEDAEFRGSHEKRVILHGGEPLMVGARRLDAILGTIQDALPIETDMYSGVETNGVRITHKQLDVFLKYGTRIGVSLDGDRMANRHRVFKNGGKESFDYVINSIATLNQPKYRHLFAGIISVANPEADAKEAYNFFRELLVPDGQPRANTLDRPTLCMVLPLGNMNNPPYRDEAHRLSAPYGQWLSQIDRLWIESGDEHLFTVREANAMLQKMQGQPVELDGLGGDTLSDITVLTDGSYAIRDTLSMTEDGITVLDVNVFDHSLEEAASAQRAYMEKLGALSLSKVCQTACLPHIRNICEGGNIAARYNAGQERPFENPAVTCIDLETRIANMYGLAAARQMRDQHHARVVPLLPDVAYNTSVE